MNGLTQSQRQYDRRDADDSLQFETDVDDLHRQDRATEGPVITSSKTVTVSSDAELRAKYGIK